jgi:hypothetical protein
MVSDPSQMSDEELDAIIDGGDDPQMSEPTEVDEPKVEEPEVQAEPEEPVEEPEESPEEPQEEPETEEPEKPSRRENLRIQQLVQKMKQSTEPKQSQPTYKGLDYAQELDAEPETIQRLEEDRQQYGNTLNQEAAELAKSNLFMTRLEIDAPKVESKHPQLNKESDDFKPQVANAINEWYLQTTGYDAETGRVGNPNIRYSEFVESIMELVDVASETRTQQTTKNIAKQAARTSLRPDGSQAKRLNLNQAPESMTDEELDVIIAQAL